MAKHPKMLSSYLFAFAPLIASLLSVSAFSLFPHSAMAWGLRGHNTICEAAAYNVQDPTLAIFLRGRIPALGNLCNIPDTSWRSKGPEIAALGGPTHFIDPEVTGLPVGSIGLDYKKLQSEFEGKDNKFRLGQKILSLHRELGSIWWRADQFIRRAIDFAATAAKAKKPENRKEEQDETLEFNNAVLEWLVNASVLGHFVGDASQPLHSTADYDGYFSGHGGIHGFYEDAIINNQKEDLTPEVSKETRRLLGKAKSLRQAARKGGKPNLDRNRDVAFLLLENPLEQMREMSVTANAELKSLMKIDVMKKKSEYTNDKGMEVKTPAERDVTAERVKAYRSMQIKQLARSAALLAQFWDSIYEKAGKPDLKSYKAYKYVFEPAFVAPDYFDVKAEK